MLLLGSRSFNISFNVNKGDSMERAATKSSWTTNITQISLGAKDGHIAASPTLGCQACYYLKLLLLYFRLFFCLWEMLCLLLKYFLQLPCAKQSLLKLPTPAIELLCTEILTQPVSSPMHSVISCGSGARVLGKLERAAAPGSNWIKYVSMWEGCGWSREIWMGGIRRTGCRHF